MRAAAIAHSYLADRLIVPFADQRVNLFRGNTLEPRDLPDAVLVFGGDGAVHRLLPVLANSGAPLLVVPCGSANDFAHCLGIRNHSHALEAWKRYLDHGDNVRSVDLGMVRPLAPEARGESEQVESRTYADADGRIARPSDPLAPAIMRHHLRHAQANADLQSAIYFSGIAGFGMDAATNQIASRMPGWLRRSAGYPLAAAAAYLRYRPLKVKLHSFDSAGRETVLADPILFAAVGNTPVYGSGMRMLPQARLDDGELDLCYVPAMPALRVLMNFHRVYSGTHLSIQGVRYLQCRQLFVESEEPAPIWGDGEYLCRTPVEISVTKEALRVIFP